MIDPIYCTECWNGGWTGDDCELHPSAPVTDDSNDVGPAIKAYTIQEKRHEKELTKFKTERAALKKRCTLQLETIRELRDRLHNSEAHLTACRSTNTELHAKLEEGFVVIKGQRENNTGMVTEIRDLRLQLDLVTEDRQIEIETRQRLQGELHSVTKERAELKAELSKQRNIGSDWEREAFKLRRVVDGMGADLDHAVEVKNRCVATINKLCSQVVELQAQLKGKE
jgi:chromosome segregation ATPase